MNRTIATGKTANIVIDDISLPYFDDPCSVFERLRHLGNAVLLDSGGDAARGRFDIITAQADPERSLFLDADCSDDKFNVALDQWRAEAAKHVQINGLPAALPFYGGYIGHFSYELGRRLHELPARTEGPLPIAVAHYYSWAIVQDRQRQCSYLVGEPTTVAKIAPTIHSLLASNVLGKADEAPAADFRLLGNFRHHWSRYDYQEQFDRVKEYIAAGDCYQINIGQPFSSHFAGDLFSAYRQLRDIARAPFSGFFELSADHSLLCLSPERLLTVDQGRVETRPIKGTRARHQEPEADRQAAEALLASEKERAENLMIVDLLRNDIGRFCIPGSVRADELFTLESYTTVHHLVSVVSGQLSPGKSPLDLLLGCMPGGSITGAPKRRAMQIIDELEPAARQAWCGSLFYLSRHGRLDSNITIRTLFNEEDRLHCWAGGGLVDDSQADAEYQEQLDKVGAFLHALENFRPTQR